MPERPKVLAANQHGGGGFFDPTREELEKFGVDLVLRDFSNQEELLKVAQDVDVLIESSVMYDDNVLSKLPRLKALCARGIGFDRFDVDAATKHGILVVNLPRVFHREVAHHTLALWLGLVRKIVPLNRWMHEGTTAEAMRRPRPDNSTPQHHIYGETFGIVSLGNIGKVVASLLAPFELNLIAYDPFVKQEDADKLNVKMVGSLNELFEQADFVSLHTPLSAATRHMVGYEQFSRMKPGALFLNNGRGPVVNEADLIRALQEGKVAGAGLDVQEIEPPAADNPLRTMENVILTPHVASASDKARVERARWIGIECGRVLTGKWPQHGLVNKSVKPRFPLSAE